MLSTGCSGSQSDRGNTPNLTDLLPIANAVRYGTAKGEWFLNVVSIIHCSPKQNYADLSSADSCSSLWGGDKDKATIPQVISRIRHDKTVYWRRGNPRHRHGSDHPARARHAHHRRHRAIP